MPLPLTTHRKQQTLSAKWPIQQQQQHTTNTCVTVSSTNLFRHHQHHTNYLNQALRKQKSFTESFNLKKTALTNQTRRAYISSGLSLGRSHDTQYSSSYPQQVLTKHSFITTPSGNERHERATLKTGDLIKKNTTSGERKSRRVQAWSSNSSILKSLDKELAQLNGVKAKTKDAKIERQRTNTEDNVKANEPKTDTKSTAAAHNSHSNRKQAKPELTKVNLNIVLSHAPLDSSKEDTDYMLTEKEADETDSDEATSNSAKAAISCLKTTNNKQTENSSNSLKTTSNTRPIVTAQQRRSLYHTSRLAANSAFNKNIISNTSSNSGIQNSQNLNTSSSLLTTQKRAPLVRAMSAPVRTFGATTKDSATFLKTKRKSCRRKLNARNKSCDNNSCDILSAKDFNFVDSKPVINRKVLTRSKSVAPDVVTLVSLISSEGSDSEKEDSSLTPHNSETGSPHRRSVPGLRKSGKSVSFQENYPPTFQLASKEYSHMLRRGSIAPLAQRLKSNRPPTAPPGSIYRNTQKLYSEMSNTNPELNEENGTSHEHIENSANKNLTETMGQKSSEENYEFPQYVRSLKERECWKLFIKMSTKGVNITYDTVLRGLLTPTEFRQLQKQREIEEAKALKAADNGLLEETHRPSPTAIDRLKESLLKK